MSESGLVEIGAQFLGGAGFAGVIAGDGEAAAEVRCRRSRSRRRRRPASSGARGDARKQGESFGDVDAKIGIPLFGEGEERSRCLAELGIRAFARER